MTCKKVSDNFYKDCPFKGDYNPFTDWRPRCAVNYQDMINNKLSSSLDYRMYLTKNAESIMKYNTEQAYIKNSCGPCKEPWNEGTMLNQFDTQECNSRTCNFRSGDPWGLGRGRKYYNDDMEKEMNEKFIKMKEKENEWFKLNKNTCLSTTNDGYETYPIGGVADEDDDKIAIPSGFKF